MLLFLYLLIYLFILFSFIFFEHHYLIFHKKNAIKTKIFFVRKKSAWSMGITSETWNEGYIKPTKLPHSFGISGGNINVPFLLLIIMLHFTCGRRKFRWMIKNFQNIMTTVAGSGTELMDYGFSSKEKHLFQTLDRELRIRFWITIWFCIFK